MILLISVIQCNNSSECRMEETPIWSNANLPCYFGNNLTLPEDEGTVRIQWSMNGNEEG